VEAAGAYRVSATALEIPGLLDRIASAADQSLGSPTVEPLKYAPRKPACLLPSRSTQSTATSLASPTLVRTAASPAGAASPYGVDDHGDDHPASLFGGASGCPDPPVLSVAHPD
jgi:hypothetical protein